MADDIAGDTSTEETTETFDVEAAADQLGADLGFGKEPPAAEGEDKQPELELTPPEGTTTPAKTQAKETVSATTRPVPKAWAKEQHEIWSKIDPKAQEYIELREKQMLDGLAQYGEFAKVGKQMQEVVSPYMATIQSLGIDAPTAVKQLLNADYRLRTSSPAEKQAYFAHLAKSYGVELPQAQQGEQQQIDPNIKALTEKVSALESSLTAREQAALNEARTKVAKDVEAFASDPKHQYFDEVSDDIIKMIKSGYSLEDAYEKAVWANPVTRAKELTRTQTENEKKLRENARLDALKAKTASSSNVRSRDTRRAPTEPLGTMEDTMKETLAQIRARTH